MALPQPNVSPSAELIASETLTIAETGALALDCAAHDLDCADDAQKFLGALDRNRRVWESIGQLAAARSWRLPNRHMVAYAIKTTSQTTAQSGRDDRIHALIDINRQVAMELAGGKDMESLRQRARTVWEGRGRPFGNDIEHWLLAEMDVQSIR